MRFFSDDEWCRHLKTALSNIFSNLKIEGGADEPFYSAPTKSRQAVLYFKSNYPRSLLHEISHFCLAGDKRRAIDDFGYWYSPCGRTAEQQKQFEKVEARPQGLEKALCQIAGLPFSPSLDDFSGRPPSEDFLQQLNVAYKEMTLSPPPTAQQALRGLKAYFDKYPI